jgi:hypothetical protein
MIIASVTSILGGELELVLLVLLPALVLVETVIAVVLVRPDACTSASMLSKSSSASGIATPTLLPVISPFL